MCRESSTNSLRTSLNKPVAAVVLPTYCEAENIESLIREIQELKLNLMIAVIDDSSPDGTAEIVKNLQGSTTIFF